MHEVLRWLSRVGRTELEASPLCSAHGMAMRGAWQGRGRIDKMSAEVVDSNPYSRLMALQRMGVVKDYERIRQKAVGSSLGCCEKGPFRLVAIVIQGWRCSSSHGCA
jgi:hypothetical protein